MNTSTDHAFGLDPGLIDAVVFDLDGVLADVARPHLLVFASSVALVRALRAAE
jgi:phosphoglycolate phosphatase-like HAD superfamily hydrolase